jgi:beta-glucanase (GH16 family)
MKQFWVIVFGILFVGGSVFGAKTGDNLKGWVLKGELGNKPKRVTETYPLSDQSNAGKWVAYGPMSDEFEAGKIDADKWYDKNPRWMGRQPAWFYDKNVTVSDGKMHLAMKKEEPAEMRKDKGYHTYTSAAVQSKGRVLYGYFEVKCKPMNSAGSSSFWFYHNTPELWTEIDVFEIGGKAKGFEKKYNMNVHVFKTPAEKRHWSKHGQWYAPTNLADDYHVYALEWDKEKVKWYFDGVLVRWVENTHWHQALTLNFDSETMPDWFGLPEDKDLPSTYSIEYVRTWKSRQDVLSSGRLMIGALGAKGLAGMTEEEENSYTRVFSFMDTDRDGKVTRAQYVNDGRYMTPQARSGIFGATDRNKDDVMTKQEYVANRAITDEAKRIVGAFDRDKDGLVTAEEFVTNCPVEDKDLAGEIFKKLDTNGSGDIIIPEYLRIWGNWARE